MPQEATVRSVAQAYRVIKQMRLQGWDAGEECREAAREAVRAHLRRRMLGARSEFLSQLQAREQVDRANGSYGRHLLTEMGTVLLQVPRTRRWSAAGLLQAYRRRSVSVDRAILGCFLLGLSTRKVARALLAAARRARQRRHGEQTSARTSTQLLLPSTAVKSARATASWCSTGGAVQENRAGAVRRPVLVALGIRHDGRKEIIDFRQAQGESTQAWEAFLNDLYRRGLGAEGLEFDLQRRWHRPARSSALVYPHVPVQLCWAHKRATSSTRSGEPRDRRQAQPAGHQPRQWPRRGSPGCRPLRAQMGKPLPACRGLPARPSRGLAPLLRLFN